MNKIIEKYLFLRHEIDNKIRQLELLHSKNINCKIGCDSCCESISVFPVELFSIKQEISKLTIPKYSFWGNMRRHCRFLIDGKCSIYQSRPIICRTQGLPILYESINEYNKFELSVCKLNFTNCDISFFNQNNSLFLSPYNSRLYLINKEFIEYYNFSPSQRLPLNKIDSFF